MNENSFWGQLRRSFHKPSSDGYRRVESIVWLLILISIALLVPEVMNNEVPPIIEVLDDLILALFAIEVTLRIATFHPPQLDFYELTTSERLYYHVSARLRFALSPMILIDLLTVLAAVPYLRGLRALRLLRLFRSSQVFRYSSPFQGIARSFEENGLLFGFAFSVFGVVCSIGGLSIFLLERGKNPDITDLGDAMWWALVTLTTVGFGDVTPLDGVGRIVGSVLMVCGMFTLALFAGVVGQSLTSSVLNIREEQFRMSPYVDHIIVCGYGPGTTMLLDSVESEFDMDQTTVVVISNGDRPRTLPPEFHFISGDPTKESELGKVRVRYAAAVIIVGSRQVEPSLADANTILTAFTIRRYVAHQPLPTPRANPLYVVGEVLDAQNAEHARTAGCDEVIETTRIGFDLVAHAVRVPGTAAIMGTLAHNTAHNIYVGVIPDGFVCPVAFAKVAHDLKANLGILVVGVRVGSEDILNPSDDYQIDQGASVIYMSTDVVLPAP